MLEALRHFNGLYLFSLIDLTSYYIVIICEICYFYKINVRVVVLYWPICDIFKYFFLLIKRKIIGGKKSLDLVVSL